jgi:hypothetical protein
VERADGQMVRIEATGAADGRGTTSPEEGAVGRQ